MTDRIAYEDLPYRADDGVDKLQLGEALEPLVARRVWGRSNEEMDDAIVDALEEAGVQGTQTFYSLGVDLPEGISVQERPAPAEGDDDPTPDSQRRGRYEESFDDEFEDPTKKATFGAGEQSPPEEGDDEDDEKSSSVEDEPTVEAVRIECHPTQSGLYHGDIIPLPQDHITGRYPHRILELEEARAMVDAADGRWNFKYSKLDKAELLGGESP